MTASVPLLLKYHHHKHERPRRRGKLHSATFLCVRHAVYQPLRCEHLQGISLKAHERAEAVTVHACEIDQPDYH